MMHWYSPQGTTTLAAEDFMLFEATLCLANDPKGLSILGIFDSNLAHVVFGDL